MVAAEAVQKDNRRAGADPLVVEREFPNLESARGDSIFHVAALVARKSLPNSLILSAALAPQTMTTTTVEAIESSTLLKVQSGAIEAAGAARASETMAAKIR